MIDLMTLPASEAERIAYAEGFPMAAQLFARIATLEQRCEELEAEAYAAKWGHAYPGDPD